MKCPVTMIVLLAAVSTTVAVMIVPFSSWDDLTNNSPDIIIARCTATTSNANTFSNGMIWSDIEVLSVLKGLTTPGKARMVSQYLPRQEERFLMFATWQSNQLYRAYNATETYRIVPLGRYFQTNQLEGKPLNEKIRLAL